MSDYISKGIDVSTWQKNINYKKVASQNIKFAICRASYGWEANQKDNQFETNIKGFKDVGIHVGAYHYAYATTVSEAEKEAKYFLSCIKGHKFDMPVYYDMEEAAISKTGRENCTKIALKFCEIVKKAGYLVGIYTNPNWLLNYLDYDKLFPKYELWLAQWSRKKDYNCGLWQYGGSTNYIDSTTLAGITGAVDKDYMYKDYPKYIKEHGLNGYSKQNTEQEKPKDDTPPAQAPSTETVKTVTYTVKSGDTLSAIAAKYKTTVAKIAKDNNISNPDIIYPGQKLKIKTTSGASAPAQKNEYISYTVKKGDTLSAIAAKYKTTVEKIAKDNKIADPNVIYVGQKLKIAVKK